MRGAGNRYRSSGCKSLKLGRVREEDVPEQEGLGNGFRVKGMGRHRLRLRGHHFRRDELGTELKKKLVEAEMGGWEAVSASAARSGLGLGPSQALGKVRREKRTPQPVPPEGPALVNHMECLGG